MPFLRIKMKQHVYGRTNAFFSMPVTESEKTAYDPQIFIDLNMI